MQKNIRNAIDESASHTDAKKKDAEKNLGIQIFLSGREVHACMEKVMTHKKLMRLGSTFFHLVWSYVFKLGLGPGNLFA